MVNNEAAVALTFSGQAADMMWENEDLEFSVPEEGSNLWFDNFVIPKTASNIDGAHAFINFMLDAEVGARIPIMSAILRRMQQPWNCSMKKSSPTSVSIRRKRSASTWKYTRTWVSSGPASIRNISWSSKWPCNDVKNKRKPVFFLLSQKISAEKPGRSGLPCLVTEQGT